MTSTMIQIYHERRSLLRGVLQTCEEYVLMALVHMMEE